MTIPIMHLKFTLKSDTTFGRGDGVPGEVDAEVQHDEYGLPYLGGRTLKGLLAMECANLLYALKQDSTDGRWWKAAKTLFGVPGSTLAETGALIIGDACLPVKLRQAVEAEIRTNRLTPVQVLSSLTTIRQQTANSTTTGAPLDQSLRAIRVIVRETSFLAALCFRGEIGEDELSLLAACVAALRRLGTGRNRGRGEVEAWLVDETGSTQITHLERFYTEVTK